VLPALDKQQTINGGRYWSVTAYSDEGTHLHRWNTFYAAVDAAGILFMSLDGAPISLADWRASR
jgi:hypothetical protein